MTTVFRIIRIVARFFAYALIAVVCVALLAVLFVGFTPVGARFAADQVSKLISTPDQTVTLGTPSGLLSGHLRLDSIVVSDTKGAFAEVQDLAVDWSPMALLTATFKAEQISAGSVQVLRPPVVTEPPKESSGDGGLPVAIRVERLRLPDIRLGKELAGTDYALAATGSLAADNNTIEADLDVNRADVPGAGAKVSFEFAPADNRLVLDAKVQEPKGGLIAGLLRLPNQPAVAFDISGEGPLSDWSGKISAALDGQPVLAVDGRHQQATDGTRRIAVKGGGDVESLLPPAFRPLFAGQTAIDLAAALGTDGRVAIENGHVATGSFDLSASGAFDPAGNNSLSATLLATNGPVDFRWPLADGEMRALISNATLSVQGQASAAKLALNADLASVDIPQAHLGGIAVEAKSDAFDLTNSSGRVDTTLNVEQTRFASADLDRAVRGPITLTAPVTLGGDEVRFEPLSLESGTLGGTVSGRYDLADKTLAAAFKLFAVPGVLPPAVAEKFTKTISAEGNVAATIGGATALSDLVVTSNAVEASGSLSLSADQTIEAALKGRLPDLGLWMADAKGAATFDLSASGPLNAPAVKVSLAAPKANLGGQAVTDLTVTADGTADMKAPAATLSGTGSIGGQPIHIDANLNGKDGAISIPDLKVAVGKNRIDGKLAFNPQFRPEGRLSFDLPDLGLIAALAGQKVSGDLKGAVDLAADGERVSAVVKASGGGIRRDDLSIVKPVIDLKVNDVASLSAEGSIRAEQIAAGANRIAGLVLTARQDQGRTDFDLKANYDGAPAVVSGNLRNQDGAWTIGLDQFSAAPRRIPLKLDKPSVIRFENGNVRLTDLGIRAGSGLIAITGNSGSGLSIDARISNLPANLADALVPSLGAEGTISGTVAVRGTPAAPQVDYNLTWGRAALAQTKSAGVAAFDIKANGRFANNQLRIDTGLSGAGGLALNGGGTVGVAGNQPLSLTFKGTLPFSLLAAQTSAQGIDLQGSARVDLTIGGTASAPQIGGSISADGARLIDVRRNVALNDLGLTVNFDRESATITRLSGKLAQGGGISVTGRVGIAPGSNYPADLTVKLDRAAYVDGQIVSTVVNGTLNLTGPLLSGPVLGGTLTLGKTSITVPEKLPASLSEIDVKHKNAPAKVRAQEKQIKRDEGGGNSGTQSSIGLNVTIEAPSQIFVRGRGIDAELGGSLTVRGTASEPIVSGGFDMRRGRMVILNKRLDFTNGKIGFGGSLTPTLDMAATNVSGATTITVSVNGAANDPAISFSSSPALPQDEILAQLIFGQSMSKLSALQIAQLADAASQLAGGRSTSLFQSLRSKLGVDDLDISTDEKGEARVSAGKYLNSRTYIELQGGGQSGGKAVINLDVGRGVKLRGEAGGDGEGAAGIFYEKEY